MIVALRRVVLEVPMMIVVVVGVRGDGDRVVRRGGGQVNRHRRRLLLLLDAQVPAAGIGDAAMLLMLMMMVVRHDADGSGGRFRAAGAVLDGGTHRAYDQRRSRPLFNRGGCCRSSIDRRSRVSSRAIRDSRNSPIAIERIVCTCEISSTRALCKSARVSRDELSRCVTSARVSIHWAKI